MSYRERIPNARQLAPVYAVIVLFVYGWTLGWFFWKLNSWLYYLTAGEILTILAYAFAVNLLESLLLLVPAIGFSIALPRHWFFDQFAARATALLLPGLLFFVFVANQFVSREQFRQSLVMALALPVVLLSAALVAAVGRWKLLRRLIEDLSDRATVFLYLTIPSSVVALLIVIGRNLS
jgi:hypothetical protein